MADPEKIEPNFVEPKRDDSNIVSTGGGSVMAGGTFESGNFITGSSGAGWKFDANGNLEANDGNFRGDITGASGTFSGTVTVDSIDIGGDDATSAHIDTDGNFWTGANIAGYATAPARISNAGVAVFTDATITGVLTVSATSSGIANFSDSGALAVEDTADFDTLVSGAEKPEDNATVGATSGTDLKDEGTSIVGDTDIINKFVGDGSDGALAITTGTTTLDLSNATIFTKNYSSISITSTGKLAFSNPATNGTLIILKSQGAVVLTSSTTPCIDATSMGAAGGAGVSATVVGNNGNYGNNTLFRIDEGDGSASSTGGVGGTHMTNSGQPINTSFVNSNLILACGAGGGSGAAFGGFTSGAGGTGGGALLINCGGALNFTGTLWSKGADAEAVTTDEVAGSAAGGGGSVIILYNSLTGNSGTIVVSGGVASSGNSGNSTYCGGGGGAGLLGTGGTGGCGASAGGGVGGAGFSLVGLNVQF